MSSQASRPKLPRITGEELVRALQRAGFEIARQKGSHVQLRKPVPIHKGKILKPGLLLGILRKAGLTVEELVELLRS